MNKNVLAIGVLFFLVISSIPPIVFGYNIRTVNKERAVENYYFDKLSIFEQLNKDNVSEITANNRCFYLIYSLAKNKASLREKEFGMIDSSSDIPLISSVAGGGLIDSPWPMYCHDTRHTGKSPYSTVQNDGNEIWFIKFYCFVEGSAVINNNILYFGTWCDFYALDLINRSILWSYDTGGNIESSPAIDENGTIYVGTAYRTGSNLLYAFYPNGTVKWTFSAGDNIHSSPVIGDDGTIYFGNGDGPPYGLITALYPNGTLKWRYITDHAVRSSPAIGLDGTVYCGSHNGYLYAFYPDNGTVKWMYKTGNWVAKGACIADDGTIYFGSWDGHLYACYPNGTLKWKTSVYIDTTPVISEDGTIYAGSDMLSAVDPVNGSVIWQYDVPGRIASGNPCISADGTIYCGTADNGYIVAVNPDGTLRWKLFFGGECFFSPIIGEDGTVYIGSNSAQAVSGGDKLIGYLHVFGKLDSNAPSAPIIEGPSKGTRNEIYNYTIQSFSPLGNDLYYWIEWGDKVIEEWIGPYKSGEEMKVSHSWGLYGDYLIRVKVKDSDDVWGPWTSFDVKIQKSKNFYESIIMRFLDKLQLLEKLLQLLK